MIATLILASHLVFGLSPDLSHEVRLGDVVIDAVASSPSGIASFDTDLRGQFHIVPVGNVPIPPENCPDLVPWNVNATAPCADQEWRVTFQVRNQGLAAAGPFVTRVSLTPPGGTRATKCTLASLGLAVGAIEDWSCTLADRVPTGPGGQWAVWIQVDHGNAIGESDETNNEW